MSEQEFQNYVALITKILRLKGGQRDLISGELQDHLRSRVADLKENGTPEDEAFRQALEEFGDATAMAQNFQTVRLLQRQRWIMRFTTLAIVGSFLMAIFAMAMWPSESHFGSPANSVANAPLDDQADDEAVSVGPVLVSAASKRDLMTEKALKQIVDLNYVETTFSEVMDDLRERTGLNFILDGSAEDDSLTKDELISILLEGLPLDKALALMLEPNNATYVIDEGMVKFISMDNCWDPEHLRIKLYDCKKLVSALPKPKFNLQFAPLQGGRSEGGYQSGSGGGGGLFSFGDQPTSTTSPDSEPNDQTLTPEQLVKKYDAWKRYLDQKLKEHDESSGEETLLKIVQEVVESYSWEVSGSGEGTAYIVNGVLIIKQSESVHRKLDHLLDDLRGQVLGTPERVTSVQTEKLGIAAKASTEKPIDKNPFNE